MSHIFCRNSICSVAGPGCECASNPGRVGVCKKCGAECCRGCSQARRIGRVCMSCQPLGTTTERYQAPLEERFWSKVTRGVSPDDCWLWTGTLSKGYGRLSKGRVSEGYLTASRVSWEISEGRPVPDGLFVLHSCDNPRCVNPKHLRIGDQIDNMLDMKLRKRKRTKLTPEQVTYLRSLPRRYGTFKRVAAELGVSPDCIREVRSRRTWRHI